MGHVRCFQERDGEADDGMWGKRTNCFILFILFFLFTLFFLCTLFFFVYTKKTKKINVHLFILFFFVYTNIRVNNFPLCEKALSLACVGFSI